MFVSAIPRATNAYMENSMKINLTNSPRITHQQKSSLLSHMQQIAIWMKAERAGQSVVCVCERIRVSHRRRPGIDQTFLCLKESNTEIQIRPELLDTVTSHTIHLASFIKWVNTKAAAFGECPASFGKEQKETQTYRWSHPLIWKQDYLGWWSCLSEWNPIWLLIICLETRTFPGLDHRQYSLQDVFLPMFTKK